MGRMFRPRRPVARLATTAAVGGVAYHMGKKGGQQQADASAQQAPAPAPPEQAPPQQYAPPAPPPAAAPADDTMAQLEKLAEMHGSGVLTDEEFSTAKSKLLGI